MITDEKIDALLSELGAMARDGYYEDGLPLGDHTDDMRAKVRAWLVEETQELAQAVLDAAPYLGCKDHSCHFIKPAGMATNGGCRCKNKPSAILALARIYHAARPFV